MIQILQDHKGLKRIWLVAMSFQILLAGVAIGLPEMADEPSFKMWANETVDQGIHKAYSKDGYWYDWWPFYLYVSKFVGLVYRYSGLYDRFGPYSHVLMFLLKCTMVLFNGFSGLLVYLIVRDFTGAERPALQAVGMVLFHPGLMLATSAFGYQDAFHTCLVLLAVWSLCSGSAGWTPVWCTLACLTKPQAVIFMVPIGVFWLRQVHLQRALQGLGTGLATVVFVVMPFLMGGGIGKVFQAYWDVPGTHPWLTGLAHNCWWVFWPFPPFFSDQIPLIGGLNGLTIGLTMLGCFSLGTAWRLVSSLSKENLVRLSAFIAFVFFMVVTQIHENHLYAMFPFLAIASQGARPLKRLFYILTGTFSLNLVLGLWALHFETPIMVGPVRLSVLNACINVGVLVWWSFLVLMDRLPSRDDR